MPQYHRHADPAAEGYEESKLKDITEPRTIPDRPFGVNTIAHFSLTDKHFSRIIKCKLMSIRRLPTTFVLACVGLAALLAAAPQAGQTRPAGQMAADELRPGMVGVGRTVFEGTRVEEFKVNILGVLDNIFGTRRSLILARLEGGPLANAGVIAGMSGSPVYVDGRLIGAVSYSLGAFAKEPIAGITPIAEMVDAASFGDTRPAGTRVQMDLPLTRENLTAALRKTLNWNRPFVDAPGDARLEGATSVSGLAGSQLGTMLRPIATPLSMSGFGPELADLFSSAFQSQGFVPTGAGVAGSRVGEMPFEGPLKPGDAVGIMLVDGDMQMGATGTVTHVDGDRIYAFGHPLYNIGPIQFPMTRAYVYTVLPSLFSSVKVSATSDVIGTFSQDRPTTVAGRLGPGPSMIPITLTLETDRGPKRTFNFRVVNDQMFTPLMTFSALLNTLGSYERQYGAATFKVTGSATLKQHEAITFDNIFSTAQSAMDASSYIVAPLTYLMGNDREKVEISGLNLTIASIEEPKTATLERVWLDDPRPRAGRTAAVKVLLRTYRGEEVVRTLPIDIPVNAEGALSIVVSDGARLGLTEQRDTRSAQKSVDQVIKDLNKSRRNNILYVRLLGSEAGAVVNGEVLSSLPPSVLAVLEADRNGGNFNALRSATLGEWELATDQAVSGTRTLSITVATN